MLDSPVAVTVCTFARTSVGDAFEVIAPIDLRAIMTPFGPLPGVAATRDQTGAWDHVGATRTIELSDGSEAREELCAYEAPRHFAYQLGSFTGPLRLLVDRVEGAWWFSERPRTHISWTYAFIPRPFCGPLVRALLAPLWRVYARRALARAVAQAELRNPPGS